MKPKKTWTSKTKAASTIGVTRRSLSNWELQYPDFPETAANGKICVEELAEFQERHGLKGNETPLQSQLKDEERKLKIEKLRFEIDVEKGKYTSNEKIVESISLVSERMKSVLRQKLEIEYPVLINGMAPPEIRKKGADLVDEICRIFHEGAKKWTPS
jgi:hypothetical protein